MSSHKFEDQIIMKLRLMLMTALLALCLSSCNDKQGFQKETEDPRMNTFLREWGGPYKGVPTFNDLDLNDLKPALILAMDQTKNEIAQIANQDEEPSFQNTIIALEKNGQLLDQIFSYYGVLSSNLSTKQFRDIQKEMAPKISKFYTEINHNEKIFKRIKYLYEKKDSLKLDKKQERLLNLKYKNLVRNGAELDDIDKAEYQKINMRLSELHTIFSNNVLAEEENYYLLLDVSQLSGLPESLVESYKIAAETLGFEDRFAVTNTRSSMEPFLKFSEERDLRETVWVNYYSRGDNNDAFDNNEIITEILKLRHKRSQLLGYENYALWRLENRMAKNPETALALLKSVWPYARSKIHEEVNDMEKIAKLANENIKIKPWDYRFYAEKVRQEKYNLNSQEIKNYLQIENLIEAMFFVAKELFNFKFVEVKNNTVPVFHPDVRVWEVTNATNNEHIGLWYLDPFARKGKRSGAWATTYRSYSSLLNQTSVLSSNNSNFVKGSKGQPNLISWDDATTFFHEFGHALHSLSSNVHYPGLGGGVRDYTEFQSQLLERWLLSEPVVNKFLIHYQTDEPIPKGLVEKIRNASKFNQGFSTGEYLASAIVDLEYHMTDPEKLNPHEFEKSVLNNYQMPDEIVMRHRSTHFGHIFSGEGYSAGYYGYIWADVLTSDAAEYFESADNGLFNKELSKKLVKYLFAPRNSIAPEEAYINFRGQEATIDALMRDRGFSGAIDQ